MPDFDAGLEGTLFRSVLAGDEEAWRALYQAHFGKLHAYVLWRTAGQSELTDDIVQDTWLTAMRRIGSFRPYQGSFLAWLRGIAANLLRNHFRRQRKRDHRPLGRLDVAAATSESPSPELQDRLARALASLPVNHEEVLRAKYLDEWSIEEIATSRKVSLKAVESLLSRAREALRVALGEPDEEPVRERL